VTLDPDNADYSHRAARMILGQGAEADLKEAGRLARRASELAPRNVDYHLTFARILSRAGLEKNAAREYEAVLKLDPQNETAKEQMKKLRWKL
jgi:Flp pilus assembly protein TadD